MESKSLFFGGAQFAVDVSFSIHFLVVNSNLHVSTYPSLPKSTKYLVSRSLDPLKAFSEGVCGSKHLLTMYLED